MKFIKLWYFLAVFTLNTASADEFPLDPTPATRFDGCVQTIEINKSTGELKTYLFDFWEGGNYDSVFVNRDIPDTMNASGIIHSIFPHEVSATEKDLITHKLNEIHVYSEELANDLLSQFRAFAWNFVDADTYEEWDSGFTPLRTGDGYVTKPLGYIEDKLKRVTIDTLDYQALDEGGRVGALFDFAIRSIIKDNTSERTRVFMAYIFQESFANTTFGLFQERVALSFPVKRPLLNTTDYAFKQTPEYKAACDALADQFNEPLQKALDIFTQIFDEQDHEKAKVKDSILERIEDGNENRARILWLLRHTVYDSIRYWDKESHLHGISIDDFSKPVLSVTLDSGSYHFPSAEGFVLPASFGAEYTVKTHKGKVKSKSETYYRVSQASRKNLKDIKKELSGLIEIDQRELLGHCVQDRFKNPAVRQAIEGFSKMQIH